MSLVRDVRRRLRGRASGAGDGTAAGVAPTEQPGPAEPPTAAGDRLEDARTAEQRGDHATAVARLREVLADDPDRVDAHALLGRGLDALDDLGGAAAAYAAARDLDPDDPVRHYRLADVLQRDGAFAEAALTYQAAIDRDPTRPAWHARLGACRRKARDYAGAAEAYRQAVARDPSNAAWHFWLGACLELSGDWPRATVAYKRADRLAAEADPPAPPPTRRLPYTRRWRLSLIRRPQYGYGIQRACELATELGIDRITVIELGVAGGNGLVAMETNAAELSELTGVQVDVVGFDTGGGLFEPIDVRDMPYFFRAGAYAMDQPALEARLERARLVIGDAAETFADFLADGPAPIGFLSFDMDVYSATAGVLAHLGDGSDHDRFLPRCTVYFDDVSGWQGQDYNRFTGELLAIDEFNRGQEQVKLAEDRTFRTLPVNHAWHHGTYTLHRFTHPEYTTYVSPADASSLALRREPGA
jgi:Flp pilus assembly protein TadD